MQHLPDRAQSPSLALLGIAPVERVLHKNKLGLFWRWITSEGIERQIYFRQLAMNAPTERPWYNRTRELLNQYDLTSLSELMENPPPKLKWKSAVDDAISRQAEETWRGIDSFLCDRQQRVMVNGVKSDWAPVLSGVPQGTVLGPLLFSLYTNDITEDIDSELRFFADDCVCYREIKDTEDTVKLQEDIDRLGCWARSWGMRFQPVKCNIMQITRKRIKKINASYSLEGTVLENVEKIKYLGVTITNDLKWNTHVSNICTKTNRTLGFLRRNLAACPLDVKKSAYKGLVRPILEYGSSVWDPQSILLQDELEKVQKRAARFVTCNYVDYETGR